MPEIVHSQAEFKDLIDRLTDEVAKVREARLDEYRAAGVEPPPRITFEEIDLQGIRDELLSVQKTLQWRGHNNALGTVYLDKARLLAFAGICQFVKERYNGAFWENYASEIGWGADQTVYNKIWARAFKLEGAELIKSATRREFVDSFVNETGIPRHLQDDLLDFFGLFWTYFREDRTNIDDIVSLIREVLAGEMDLDRIPTRHSIVLRNVCKDVSDLASSFARRVAKLLSIASFIENSDEIIPDGRKENLDLIEEGTGIDPRSVFRNPSRLEKFWNFILERVTHDRLEYIILGRFRDKTIEKPDGSRVEGHEFKCDMYGGYSADGTRFICVPDISLSLEFLENLDEDSPVEISSGLVIRSTDRISLIREGDFQDSRGASVLPLFIEGREMGYVSFLAHQAETASVRIRGSHGEDRGSLRPSVRRYFNPRLRIRWNWRRKRYALYARLGSISLVFRSHPSSTCRILASSRAKPLAELELNQSGEGKTKMKDLIFASPQPGTIDFWTAIDGGEDKRLDSLVLDQVMLFARSRGGQISPGAVSRSGKAPTSGFVLLISSEVSAGDLTLDNLATESEEAAYGGYRIVPLRWESTTRPCSIAVEHSERNYSWAFDTCLEFDIDLRRCGWTKPEGIRFPPSAATTPEDFEVRILPSPSERESDLVRLEAAVSDGRVISVPLAECGWEPHSDEEARVSGKNLLGFLGPIIDKCDQPTRISLWLSSATGRSKERDFVFLPVFSVRYEDLEAGVQPSVRISIDHSGNSIAEKLEREGPGNELNAPSIYLENEGEEIGAEGQTYSCVVMIPEFDLRFDTKVELCPACCFLWSDENCAFSELEDLEFSELSEWELLTIDPVSGGALRIEGPLELEARDSDIGICRRSRMVETKALLDQTSSVKIDIAGVGFHLRIKNEPRVKELMFRPNTRGGAIVGRHLLVGGRSNSVFYRVYEEGRKEIVRTSPYFFDPKKKEAEEVVIPLPRDLGGRQGAPVFVEGFLKKSYGVDFIEGAKFEVSTRDSLLDEDLMWAKEMLGAESESQSLESLVSLLEAIDLSRVSGQRWEDFRFELAKHLLDIRSKKLVGRCKDILKREFNVNV